MVGDITNILAFVVSIVMMIIGLITFAKNVSKDNKAEDQEKYTIEKSLIKVDMKLDQVCKTTQDTRVELKEAVSKINTMEADLLGVKCNIRNAFTQIEELKERIEHNE